MNIFSGYKAQFPAFKLNSKHNLELDTDIKNEIQIQASLLARKMHLNNSHSVTVSDRKDYLYPKIRFFSNDNNYILSIDYRGYKTYHAKFDNKLELLEINSTTNDIKNIKECANEIKKALKSIFSVFEFPQSYPNKEVLLVKDSN